MQISEIAYKNLIDFLVAFWGNDLTTAEIEPLLRSHYDLRPMVHNEVIASAKILLAGSAHDVDLLDAITWEVNRVLDPCTTDGARVWLAEALKLMETAALPFTIERPN